MKNSPENSPPLIRRFRTIIVPCEYASKLDNIGPDNSLLLMAPSHYLNRRWAMVNNMTKTHTCPCISLKTESLCYRIYGTGNTVITTCGAMADNRDLSWSQVVITGTPVTTKLVSWQLSVSAFPPISKRSAFSPYTILVLIIIFESCILAFTRDKKS